jgi:predicted transcriptional regulator
MYKAFLSHTHTQVKEYVKTLIDNGFLRYDLTSQTYKITKKGLRFLQLYNQMDDMVNLSQLYEQEQKQEEWI